MIIRLFTRYKKQVFCSFICCNLVLLRYLLTLDLYYFFLLWNLFLAAIPFAVTQFTPERILKKYLFPILGAWLAFLPNSFYVFTDLIHIQYSTMKVYDTFMVLCFAMLSSYFGYASLLKMNDFLPKNISDLMNHFLNISVLFICSFGIYLGRFLRYNSWNILSDPFHLLRDCISFVRFPRENLHVWIFTTAFGILLSCLFIIFQKLIPQKDAA